MRYFFLGDWVLDGWLFGARKTHGEGYAGNIDGY